MKSQPVTFILLVWQALVMTAAVYGVEHVTFQRSGKVLNVTGHVQVEAVDGGLLLLAPDAVLWTIQPHEQLQRQRDGETFRLLGRKELGQSLLDDMPRGFRIHDTAHYVVCYNTSNAYARWCGELYERLYRGFMNYWKRRNLDVYDPPAPLVAVVFDRRGSYARYARSELGQAVKSISGYYSVRTNRIAMFDLTGVERFQGGARTARSKRINQILSQPNALPTVATIIHEATHQLAFNCGLHTRYADIPLWLSEGLAIVFETPQLDSSRSWRGVIVNYPRLRRFRMIAGRRPSNSLVTLLTDDDRLRDPQRSTEGYAEAWALCYFLMHRYPEEFAAYLGQMSKKQALLYDEPEDRLREFRVAFGSDITELDKQFLRYISRLD